LPSPEREAELASVRRLLDTALEKLPPRGRAVIDFRDFREWPVKRIGAVLGVHESRVSQIRTASLAQLRVALSSRGKGFFLSYFTTRDWPS